MPAIHVYAELLLNLRQVSLFITLPTPSNKSTTVALSGPSQDTFAIQHDGETVALTLPCPVETKALTLPKQAVKGLSFRLQTSAAALDEARTLSCTARPGLISAITLPVPTKVVCVQCGAIFLDSVRQWKDLPSGGWADMMDLWHCHKPEVPGAKDIGAGSQKGYAAGNALKPSEGCGLIDAGSFYFLSEGCENLKVRTCAKRTVDFFA